MRIMIDVDQTVVNTATGQLGWLNWLAARWPMKDNWQGYRLEESVPYALDSMFAIPEEERAHAMEFWSNPEIYQHNRPIPGADRAVDKLRARGHEIVFCSVVTGGHDAAKRGFIKRWFGDQYPVVLIDRMKDKRMIDADMIIDDRNEALNAVDRDTIRVLRLTPFQQTQTAPREYEFTHWDQVVEIVDRCPWTGKKQSQTT